jgi:hypothetical protein
MRISSECPTVEEMRAAGFKSPEGLWSAPLKPQKPRFEIAVGETARQIRTAEIDGCEGELITCGGLYIERVMRDGRRRVRVISREAASSWPALNIAALAEKHQRSA